MLREQRHLRDWEAPRTAPLPASLCAEWEKQGGYRKEEINQWEPGGPVKENQISKKPAEEPKEGEGGGGAQRDLKSGLKWQQTGLSKARGEKGKETRSY